MSKYIDAHSHITPDFNFDVASSMGIVGVVVNATGQSEWNVVADLSMQSGIYGAIGIHPWHVLDATDGWDSRLTDMLVRRPDLMVGEIGLDKNFPDLSRQESVFARQIEIAARLNRVAHVHCVGAWGALLRTLENYALPNQTILFHSFGASVDIMNTLISKYDAYFSFSSFIGGASHRRARECAKSVPEQKMLIESDGGPLNSMVNVASLLADMRRVPVANMTEILYNNSQRMLKYG